MDLTEYTDEQLNELEQAIAEERDRRYIMANMPDQIEQMIASYQDANGLGTGEEWKAPTGAHDAYRQGAIVEHNGKLWESLTPANVGEPGVSGVRFGGKNFESLMNGNVWTPVAYPAGWKELT